MMFMRVFSNGRNCPDFAKVTIEKQRRFIRSITQILAHVNLIPPSVGKRLLRLQTPGAWLHDKVAANARRTRASKRSGTRPMNSTDGDFTT
jgi:hypothetical protein